VSRIPVEEGMIIFARSTGDPNPIYSDVDYAAASELGGIIASRLYVQCGAQFGPDNPPSAARRTMDGFRPPFDRTDCVRRRLR
jgi:hypothetical protein